MVRYSVKESTGTTLLYTLGIVIGCLFIWIIPVPKFPLNTLQEILLKHMKYMLYYNAVKMKVKLTLCLSTIQNGSEAHPASYPVGTWGSFPGAKAAGAWNWPLTSI
jgi:hypothetical protein